MSTFTQNGVKKKLASPKLDAATQGSRVAAVAGGILVQTSDGQSSIIVTQVNDFSTTEANMDGLENTPEDQQLTIAKEFLLNNDTLAGILGNNPVAGNRLEIRSVTANELTHGTLTEVKDANGKINSILFMPDKDYHGEVEFTYTLGTTSGPDTAVARVKFNVFNVNDAPVVTGIDPLLAPIYGYDRKLIKSAYDGDPAVYGKGAPRYAPYTGFDYVTGTTGYHGTPIEMYDPDPNAGKLIVTDVDGNTNFKYEVIYQPQGGARHR